MRRLVLIGAMALVVAACGGDDGTAPAADADDAVVGGDLDLPSWFPSPFTLPDDLRVVQVVEDQASQRASLYGVVDDGDAAEILDLMATGLPADGFERVTDGTDPLVFLKDGVGRVRVRVGALETQDGPVVEVRVDIDTWTDEQLAQLRATLAEDVKTTGSAVAVIDGTTYEASGECLTGGGNYVFVSIDDPSMSVQIDQRTDPVTVYADAYIAGEDPALLFVPASDNSLDHEVQSPATPIAFTVSGQVVEQNAGDGAQLDAQFDVTCD